MADHVLEINDVAKRFGATLALDDISLHLDQGEILALLGDNGAGKSTLIKILSGVVAPDAGEIRIDGEEVRIDSPHRARELGIETVYQDLALFDNFNATGNFYAGREPVRPGWLGSLGWVSDREMAKETETLLDKLQVNISRDDEIGIMSGGQRQAVACARAIAFGKRIVILDEPTSALGARVGQRAAADQGGTGERGLGDRHLAQPGARHPRRRSRCRPASGQVRGRVAGRRRAPGGAGLDDRRFG